MAHLPHTPASAISSSDRPVLSHLSWPGGSGAGRSFQSSASSAQTYLLPSSPMKPRRPLPDVNYRPTLLRTTGQRPACLVNASVTYCGDNQIYAFGGFDQYTDEVYNHVLKLDLDSLTWSLVDNYGDIPGVRMGHTATLWQGDKLLIYGGENEHRDYLSDVVIFDIRSSAWRSPDLRGIPPRGRARHAAVVHDDKLFILGGVTGSDAATLDEICYLDLRTWTWSRSWSFVPRFDHEAWVWNSRIWVFGGLGPNMERTNDLWWLDLKSSPAFKSNPTVGTRNTSPAPPRPFPTTFSTLAQNSHQPQVTGGSTPHAANSSSVQVRSGLPSPRPIAPGAISSVRFTSGRNLPSQGLGTHFHAFSSGTLLDFVTPAGTIRSQDLNLSALELQTFQWHKLVEGSEIFDPSYRWQYCVLNEDGTKAWLLGYSNEAQEAGVQNNLGEYLSDVLSLDLKRYGLLGREMTSDSRLGMEKIPASDRHPVSALSALGADLAGMFDQPPESGSGSDFLVTAEADETTGSDPATSTESEIDTSAGSSSEAATSRAPSAHTSPPIHVHKLILQARWPHFERAYSAQMTEFHTKRMHLPENYRVVRAFLWYLYTDSIAEHAVYIPSLREIAGLLVLAHLYDMRRLRLLCLDRLSRELDIESAAVVWQRAGEAQETSLRRHASEFCRLYWGGLVRTEGFRRLSHASLMELCEVADPEGRVVNGEELEVIGGLGGGRLGVGGTDRRLDRATLRQHSSMLGSGEELPDFEEEDEDGMEVA